MKIVVWILISIVSMYAMDMSSDELTQISECKAGNVERCYSVSLALTTGTNAEDQDKKALGYEYMRRACKYGHLQACDTLGENYFKEQHYFAAKNYLESACKRNKAKACTGLGTMYRDGNEVRQDDALSREYYEKACDLRDKDSCINVSIIYRGGFGVAKSRQKEKEFYKKACDAGSKVGCDSFKRMDNKDKGIQEPGIWMRLKSFLGFLN